MIPSDKRARNARLEAKGYRVFVCRSAQEIGMALDALPKIRAVRG